MSLDRDLETELLLVWITHDWRQPLDMKYVVGMIFVDFCKAFDAIPHSILLRKLQGLGVAGDLLCWIRDYLSGRTQATTINGCQSQTMAVTFGVPQGSVLGPTLFSLFCNDCLKMGDYVVEELVSTRCLGVLVDNTLTW